MTSPLPSTALESVLNRRTIFTTGKGGVGKTAVSQAMALYLSRKNKKVLWVEFENPNRTPGELKRLSPTLSHLNCDPALSFEEYVGLRIGVPALTRIFLKNKLMRYLAKAAPGIHDLVLMGKVWHERLNYDHIVVDMPSTGYGLAMFQSTENFATLFTGGPIHRDADAMLTTFRDNTQTGIVVVALPEEMPLTESLELGTVLGKILPDNPPAYIVNRVFPQTPGSDLSENPDLWANPVPTSAEDYARKRNVVEAHNLKLWDGLTFYTLGFTIPTAAGFFQKLVDSLALQLDAQNATNR